jgi:hypothetical protein
VDQDEGLLTGRDIAEKWIEVGQTAADLDDQHG